MLPRYPMSERHFFDTTARSKVRNAIVAVEAKTSAELVVAMRRQSDSYVHVDLAFGSLFAFIVLLLLLFLPQQFSVRWIPVDVFAAFFVGAAISWAAWSLKRWLVRNDTMQSATWRAACTLFHEKKISRTSGRNGVLVLVSMLERYAQVVIDIGIDTEALGPDWQRCLDRLQAAVRAADFDSFVNGLVELGPVLGAAMPRAEDDVNELPDDPDLS